MGQMVSPIWVLWFHQSGWVLCLFCSEALIDFYLLGSDGLDVAVIWWFFFFFSLIWVFGSSEILVGNGHGRHGGGGVVMIGGCLAVKRGTKTQRGRDMDEERSDRPLNIILLYNLYYFSV